MELKDFTSECMLEWSGSLEELRNSFCRACAQAECQHSFAAATATAKKVRRHEEMMQFRAPEEDGAYLPVVAEQVSSAKVVEAQEIPLLEDLQTQQRGEALVQLVSPTQDVVTADLGNIGARLAEVRATQAEVAPKVVELNEPPPLSMSTEGLPPLPPDVKEAQTSNTQEAQPPPPSVTEDPWALPLSHERHLDYTEKEPEEDPWSVDYKGARSIKAQPGQKIVLSGAKNGDS